MIKYETIAEAAARLGVHERTVYRKIEKGELPVYHRHVIPRTVVKYSDVTALMTPAPRRADRPTTRPRKGVSSP